MAVTSKASTVINLPLRTFNTGPGFLREAPDKDQQLGKKSAAERLTESRSKFIRRESQDELDDNWGEENQRNQTDRYRARQIHVTPTHNDSQGYVFRAVPYVYDGDKGHQPTKKSRPRQPPPVPDKPSQSGPTGMRKGSRDRTLEIVAASLAHSTKQNTAVNDGLVSLHTAVVSTDSSNSNSPLSAKENISAGSRVQRLKEQFLNIGSPKSKSETSPDKVSPTELQKPDSSSSFPSTLKNTSFTFPQKDFHKFEFQEPADADAIKSGSTFSELTELSVRGDVEAVNPEKSLGTSSEDDQSPGSEMEMKVPTASSDILDEQTRRQIERFKAMHATDAVKEISQERKISKIVLKPPNQAADSKERSNSVKDQSRKISSSLVQPRLHTSKDGTCSSDQLADTAFQKGQIARPQALFNTRPDPDGDRKTSDKSRRDGTSQIMSLTNHGESSSKVGMMNQDMTLTSADVRRLRRTKEHNICGKSPEHWGDPEERIKDQRSVPEHSVHHAGDRVLVQVSGSVFPTKHYVSGNGFQTRLQPEDSIQQDSHQDVIHSRAKSDLDHSNAVLISTKEADPVQLRQHSHDDQLQGDPLIPVSIPKISAPLVSFEPAKTTPDSIGDFQKKSWAPVNFSHNKNRNDDSKRDTQGNLSHSGRALSPDASKSHKDDVELQTPWRHVHHQNTPRKIFSPEDIHDSAKSRVQSFLSGIMSTPEGSEIPVKRSKNDTNRINENLRPKQLQNDSNGNRITVGSSATKMPSEPACGKTNIAETHWAYRADVSDEVNSNVYPAVQNLNKPADVPWKDVELHITELCDERDRNERKASVSRDMEADAGPGRMYIKHYGRSKVTLEHSVEEQSRGELDKRRKVSQDSDISLSRYDKPYLGHTVRETSNAEQSRDKKVSLSELLKDAPLGETVSSDRTDQLKRAEATKSSREEVDSKWSAPQRPNRSHGNDSETDSDVDLQQSKVMRAKKPRRHVQTKKEDKSLQHLLSRIINPEDELNTLKRGQKIRPPEDPKPETTRKSSRDKGSNISTCESKNEARMDHVFATQQKSVPKKYNTNFQPIARKPLLNLNLKESINNRAVKPEDTTCISPPESLTSPTRRDFPRRRSKSDLGMSPLCSVSSAHSDMERFFNQMGLNESFKNQFSPLQLSDEDEVFHEMHEYKHIREDDGRSFSTENSDNLSHGSKVSEEGLHRVKKLPDTSQSIITKNARVIKWLCQMRKARAASFS